MKNLILIILTTLSLSCCSKDDNKTPLEQLPPATQIGASTFGCLLDGVAFVPGTKTLLKIAFINMLMDIIFLYREILM